MVEHQNGAKAPVYRALFTPRLMGGLSRDLAMVYWGVFSIPLISFPLPILWKAGILAVALIGHKLLAYRGRENPDWYKQLKRKWDHGHLATSFDAKQVKR